MTARFDDIVCLKEHADDGASDVDSLCIENFPIFQFIYALDLNTMKATIGIAPTCPSTTSGKCSPFVLELFEQGKIDKPEIAFNLGIDLPSVIVGGIETNDFQDLVTVSSYAEDSWATTMTAVYYDNELIIPLQKNPPSEDISPGNFRKALFNPGEALINFPK